MSYFCSSKFINDENMQIHILSKGDELLARFRAASDTDFCVQFVIEGTFGVVLSVPNMKVVCVIPDENSDRYALTDREYDYLVSIIKQHANVMYEMEYRAVPCTVKRSGIPLYKLSFKNDVINFDKQHQDIEIFLPDDSVESKCHVFLENHMTAKVYNVYLTSNKSAFVGDGFSYADVVMFITTHWDEIVEKWNERFMSDTEFYI